MNLLHDRELVDRHLSLYRDGLLNDKLPFWQNVQSGPLICRAFDVL
jgi:hypothetical protein